MESWTAPDPTPATQPHVWRGLDPPPQHTPNVGGNDRALPRYRDELRRKCPSPWGPDERDLKPCHVSAVLAQGGPQVPGQGHHRVPASPRRLGSGSGSERGSLSGQQHETATQGGERPRAFSNRAAMGTLIETWLKMSENERKVRKNRHQKRQIGTFQNRNSSQRNYPNAQHRKTR